MNIFGYDLSERERFIWYLQRVGFSANGAAEAATRISENRPDREDLNNFRRYRAERQA